MTLHRMLVGSYSELTPWTGAPDGHGRGVLSATIDRSTGAITLGAACELPNPSFVARHRDQVWASCESEGIGSIHMLGLPSDPYAPVQVVASCETGVRSPCHVAADETRGLAVLPHYHGHLVSTVALDASGRPTTLLEVIELPSLVDGEDRSGRVSLPHFALWVGNEHVLVTDCGRDLLALYRIAATGRGPRLQLVQALLLPVGCGPRHAVMDDRIAYVGLQNQAGVAVVSIDVTREPPMGLVQLVDSPGVGRAVPLASHIGRHAPSGTVYLTNRRDESMSVYERVSEAGELELRSTVYTHGVWTRHFELSPESDFMVLANQNSNELVVFAVAEDGSVEFTGQRAAVPTPTCVLHL